MTDSSDAPRHVLITGASSGIGKACAQYLAEKGYSVFAGVRTETQAEALGSGSAGRLTPVLFDVCSHQSVGTACDFVERSIAPQGLHGLINNAGIAFAGPMEFVNSSGFQHLLNVNLTGAVTVTQAFLPLLRKQKGRIINMGSISGRVSLPFLGSYSASKFALEAITDALRIELRPWGISVTVIEPGNVETPIRSKALERFEQDIQLLPPSAYSLYGPVFDLLKSHSDRKAVHPHRVARLVDRVLAVRKPKPRYILGADAAVLSFIQQLPSFLRDAIIARRLPEYGGSQR